MPHSKGFRFKSRRVTTKKSDGGFTKRLLSLKKLSKNDQVAIKIDPTIHKSMPHRRYQGNISIFIGWRGRALVVETNNGKKPVTLVVRPDHVKRIK